MQCRGLSSFSSIFLITPPEEPVFTGVPSQAMTNKVDIESICWSFEIISSEICSASP